MGIAPLCSKQVPVPVPHRTAAGSFEPGGEEHPKKGSKQTEILCMVNCLCFLPRSPGRAAPLLSPAPFLAKRKGDDETCCFFSCCAYKPSALLWAGGGDGCPSVSSVAGWERSLEPEMSPSPSTSPM